MSKCSKIEKPAIAVSGDQKGSTLNDRMEVLEGLLFPKKNQDFFEGVWKSSIPKSKNRKFCGVSLLTQVNKTKK